MDKIRLSELPKHFKLLISSLLCIIGLVYIVLIVNIWIDTELRPSIIIEAYGDMEYIELSANAHIDLPHYALFILALPVLLFMFSSYSDKLKRFLAVFPFVMVIVDVGSMYLIPYLNKVFFSYTLWLAGTCLAVTFLLLFIFIQYDMWFKKQT
ncbi:hypothetical protein ACFL5S_01035 [Fibrobacterota bacterium]